MKRYLISFGAMRPRLGGCDMEHGAALVSATSEADAFSQAHALAARRLGPGWVNISVKIEEVSS